MDKKDTILRFLKTQRHAVIATSDMEKPEAALIGFGESDDLTLIFGTFTSSRKYKNIQKNKKIALVVGFNETTVQYEGSVEILNGKELTRYKRLFYKKTPSAQQYESHPEQVFFKATPSWIRYVDFTVEPHREFECTF